ncbi:threonine/serine dehydratase [Mariniblastus sp.]|nr:threonine/serine dehydratase [bacterium]MDA7880138.1 threonine/serine dehydratase [Mariniblastus sp.]MDA7903444.1 threonine/serine dehydratase [Mariniblastus sp.]MDA7904150.1 threonine/serine dehydratase [bacterium]MDA7924149.1 threonine/serine dehydratase [Mariniblastus sp.]
MSLSPHPDVQSIHDRVPEVALKIKSLLQKTPLLHSAYYSNLTGANVFFKYENLQTTGSFKIRGASAKLIGMSKEALANGIVTASTGNHGKAVAFAAQSLGMTATIYAPTGTSPFKIAAITELGAKIIFAGSDCVDAELTAVAHAIKNNATYVAPYNDTDVIAGQGTLGLEISDQLDSVDAVFLSMGGGGLASGVGAFLKTEIPNCKIIGCSPENSCVLIKSLEAGELLPLPSTETLSDGTAGGVEPGSITFPLCQKIVDQCYTVSETEIRSELIRFMENEKKPIEGAAAVAIAGLLKSCDSFKDKNVVVLLCGGNVSSETLKMIGLL